MKSLAAILLLLVASVSGAGAQTYPSQTIKLVVPFAAGGGVDVVARIISPALSEALGQPVVVENRGGAGGMLGASAVAQAAPDGYTLLLGTGSTHGTNSAVYAKLGYDPVRDFVPVVQVTQSPLLLVVPTSSPLKSVSELIAKAKAKPGEMNYGSYGPGSINHLGAELFNSMAAIKVNHVPYRGSAPALVDLMGGRLDYVLDGISTTVGYIQSSTLRLLGVASLKRTPLLPDAPTISEAGLQGYDTSVWFGILAPAAAPQPVVALINAKVNTVLASNAVKDGLERLGIERVGGGPEVLGARVQSEIKKWESLVKAQNIRVNP